MNVYSEYIVEENFYCYLNVNQNIAGTDVSSNSGNKDAATQRVVIATDDIPTGLTNTILNAVNG